MPRANRYILPGYIYHLTHRCHNRSFLFRFAIHRREYYRRLRAAVLQYRISLFNYAVTCNHVHFLVKARNPADISRFMHKLQGQFATHYNSRKERSGAFWEERYRATMVEGGQHLLNCLRYIDLNMVRAGAVSHPEQWPWCGYHELIGSRQRYRLLDLDSLLPHLEIPDQEVLARVHGERIAEAINGNRLCREGVWTESIAVGSESFVRIVVNKTRRRKRLLPALAEDGTWFVRDVQYCYGSVDSS